MVRGNRQTQKKKQANERTLTQRKQKRKKKNAKKKQTNKTQQKTFCSFHKELVFCFVP